MNRSKVGVIVGRFQPFHLGHAWLIKKAIKKFGEVLIIVGSPIHYDEDNIWSLKTRVAMLNLFLDKEGIKDKIIGIYEVKDVPDDDDWLNLMLKTIGKRKFVVLGDNEWVNGIFENAGHAVFRTGFYKRERYEGTKIRKLIRGGLTWEDRVPGYSVSLLKK